MGATLWITAMCMLQVGIDRPCKGCSMEHCMCTEGMLYCAGWLGKKVYKGVFDYPKPAC